MSKQAHTLADYYLWLISFSELPRPSDMATALEAHFGIPRKQATRLTRILCNWAYHSGYVPAQIAASMTFAPTWREQRRATVKALWAQIRRTLARMETSI